MTDFNSLDPVEVLDAVNYHFPDEHIEDEDGDIDSENNVDNVIEPKVGMEFNSAEEIWYYYLAYGRQQGFMVAKRSSRKGKDNKLRDVVYECNKRGNGRSNRKDRLPIRPRPQIKLGCNAHISASVLPNGKWSIKTVQSVHNHDQSPGISDEHFRSYKKHKMELSVKNEAMVEVASPLLKEAEETSIIGHRPFTQQIYTGEGEEEESDVNQFFVVQSSSAEMLKPQVGGDRPRVDLRESKCQEIWKPWRRALIIKVLGLDVDFETMRKELSDLWSHIKGFELVEMEFGFLIVRFYSKVDYEWISKNGPWMILGHYLTVAHWRPYFVPSEKFFPILSIWVRLLNPPIEFFHEDILLQIGNLLGVASKIDENFPVKRSYARICVQVDLRKPLVPIVEVNELELQIGYEGLHEICFECGKYGHKLEGCPTRQTSMNALTPTATSPFGPWMVVSNWSCPWK